MFFSITGRLLPGADDVELLDVLVPQHGGSQPGLKLSVVLGSSDEEVLCPHYHNTNPFISDRHEVCCTCHGVILPGHVAEALHQSSLQLPGTRAGDTTEMKCDVI